MHCSVSQVCLLPMLDEGAEYTTCTEWIDGPAGGSVQYLFVDNLNGVVLASMLDKVTRAYDLDSKQPCIKYVGHDEVVRGVDYLPERGLYVTGMNMISSSTCIYPGTLVSHGCHKVQTLSRILTRPCSPAFSPLHCQN